MCVLTYVLAAIFLMSGLMKLIQPKSKLDAKMATLKGFSSWQVKAIGALEVLAALGLAPPLIFDTGLNLVPVAATGLVLLMIGALITHARLKEFPVMAITAVLGALSMWVAIWGYSDLIT